MEVRNWKNKSLGKEGPRKNGVPSGIEKKLPDRRNNPMPGKTCLRT